MKFLVHGWQLMICLSVVLVPNVESVSDNSQVCLDGKHHKAKPEPETASLGQCSSWKAMSCCSNETAHQIAIDKSQLYNFNYSHCGKISQQCMSWFIKNHCFYECSPNLGPWLIKVNSSYRNERFKNLPLCKSTCDGWWEACQHDKTCVIDWSKGFKWSKDGNTCPQNSLCKSIQMLFSNSTFFCETIYGPYDYKVVSDDQCITFNFTGENPNTKVAKAFANAKQHPHTPANNPFSPFVVTSTPVLQNASTVVSVVLASLVLTVACCVALVFMIKWLKQKPFWQRGIPFQFKLIIPSKQAATPTPHESEMLFMGYDEEEDEEPELGGTLRMEL